MASVLRIGKESYGYVYTYHGGGVYKCERCSDWGDKDTEVLWLMKSNDVWHAFDGPKDTVPTSVPTDGKVAFISVRDDPNGDALNHGNHTWTMVKARGGPQDGTFQTYHLDE